MTVILIACATFVSTLAGGLLALRLRDKLHLILGFSAGAVIGVALFDLLPEAMEHGAPHFGHRTIAAVVALGFLTYLVLDRLVFLHLGGHEPNERHHADPAGPQRGILGASSLAIHSFFDGAAIGLGFHVSSSVGVMVAAAVLVHDFSDGINTVTVILRERGDRGYAFRWLLVDALAPVAGAASTFLFRMPEEGLGLVLAAMSGFFVYIGASDLVPESQHAHPKFLTTVMTLLGAALLYVAMSLAKL